MRANASTFGDERLTQLDGERAPEGVGARLVRQPPDRDLLSGDAAEELSQPADGPGAVRVVAPLDSPQQVRGKTRLLGALGEKDDVAGQRAACECGAGTEVCRGADPLLALETALDLLRVRAAVLADRGDLVDERHRHREK